MDKAGSVLEDLAAKTGTKLESSIVEELTGLTKFDEKNESETVKRTIADLFKTRPMRNGNLSHHLIFMIKLSVFKSRIFFHRHDNCLLRLGLQCFNSLVSQLNPYGP